MYNIALFKYFVFLKSAIDFSALSKISDENAWVRLVHLA